jgi:hypothetical protein
MLVAAAVALTAVEAGAFEAYDVAQLRALDKVSARVSTLRAVVGVPVRFERLQVVVHACRKQPPEETPEAAAFLEIREIHPVGGVEEVFRGWMFASSPALSAMDHPVYDVWVVDCVSSAASAAPSTSGGSPP